MLVPDFVTRRLLLSRVEMIYLEHTWRITTLAGWIIKKNEGIIFQIIDTL